MSTQESSPGALRPQTIGQLLDDTFRTFRYHFKFIALTTLCVYVPYLIIQSIFAANLGAELNQLQKLQTGAEFATAFQAELPRLLTTLAITIISALLITPLLYGAIVHFLKKHRHEGETITWKQALGYSGRRLLPVIGTSLLKWLILILLYAVGVGIVAGLVVVLGLVGSPGILAGFVGVLAGIAALCLFIWIVVRYAFSMSVAVAEPKAGWGAIRRSWTLVKGNFWRVVGYLIVVQLIVGAVSFGLTMLMNLIPSIAVRLIFENVVSLITTPFSFIALALMYLDLCVRTDALDMKDWLNGGSDSGQ